MEYQFYAEQKYLPKEGRVEARILAAEEAGALGYEDGYVQSDKDSRLYVDGFYSEEAARHHLESLAGCRIKERPKPVKPKERGSER